MQQKKKPSRSRSKGRARSTFDFDPDKIYFDGVVVETLPGVRFKVKIDRTRDLEPLILECNTKTIFKLRKNLQIIKGDTVTVELDPSDNLTRGTIVALKKEAYIR
jgi:translation initiation factor IF-1